MIKFWPKVSFIRKGPTYSWRQLNCTYPRGNLECQLSQMFHLIFYFIFSLLWDMRQTCQSQSTRDGWPPSKFFVKQREDFTAGNRTVNVILKIWVSLHYHPLVEGRLGPPLETHQDASYGVQGGLFRTTLDPNLKFGVGIWLFLNQHCHPNIEILGWVLKLEWPCIVSPIKAPRSKLESSCKEWWTWVN